MDWKTVRQPRLRMCVGGKDSDKCMRGRTLNGLEQESIWFKLLAFELTPDSYTPWVQVWLTWNKLYCVRKYPLVNFETRTKYIAWLSVEIIDKQHKGIRLGQLSSERVSFMRRDYRHWNRTASRMFFFFFFFGFFFMFLLLGFVLQCFSAGAHYLVIV
jgi:hypothetical protein